MKRVTIAAALGALTCMLVVPAATASATTGTARAVSSATAPRAAAPSYRVTRGHAERIAASAAGVSGLPAVPTATSPLLTALRGALPSPSDANPAARTARASAPRASADTITTVHAPAGTASGTASASRSAAGPASAGDVIHAFNGVSDKDSAPLFGSPVTPPDQGLCAGKDTTLPGGPSAVWEPVNEAARETSKDGAALRPDVSLGTIFQDQFFIGDVRCVYDPSSATFYFTEIGFPVATGPASDGNNTTIDVAAVNAGGVAEYQFDTSLGGTCFGDQPKTGFDNDALVISTDEYCGKTESVYKGAIAVVISKSQLAAGAATVNDDVLGPLSQGGNPVLGLDPATGTGSGTEYFVDSTAFKGSNQRIVPSANTLGLWTLADTASVTTGGGTPSLSVTVLASETYAFPVSAASTGDGSTTTLADGTVVTSETALQPDDDRTSGPVNVTPAPGGGVDLWTAVDSAVTPAGDSATRDGAAWFEISTSARKVVGQGYIAAKGAYLLYPAIDAAPGGPAAAVFTITGASVNPAIAYNVIGSPTVTTVAVGSGPHLSFSDPDTRWGDYSMAVPDPDGSGIWMATEYIPPPADQDPDDNWGTYVFEVSSP